MLDLELLIQLFIVLSPKQEHLISIYHMEVFDLREREDLAADTKDDRIFYFHLFDEFPASINEWVELIGEV